MHRLKKYESSQAHVNCYYFMPYCAFSNTVFKYGIYYAIVYICGVYCFCMIDCQPRVLTSDYFDHVRSICYVWSVRFFFFWEMELRAL